MRKVSVSKQLTPAQAYQALRGLSYPLLLESAMVHPEIGRYSFVAADPFLVFTVRGEQGLVDDEVQPGQPLQILRELLAKYQLPPSPDMPPFVGGAAGYIGYDLGRLLEKLPATAVDDLAMPECQLCFYDTVVVFDHLNGETAVYATGLPEIEMAAQVERANSRAALFAARLSAVTASGDDTFSAGGSVKCPFDRDSYCQAVEKVINYIRSGDIYQVNLSQRFSIPFSGSPLALYRKLAGINPAPFAALLEWPEAALVSASPERFLHLQDNHVESRPIKGTRPRGKTPVADQVLRDELWASAKDRAELTMIVDLVRNDLGRVSQAGSVQVPELFRLEKYATVWHLVATIVSRLQAGKDIIDLIQAAFPGGSITGAPKIRAMEIIEELEPVRRSVYTGSIGYIGFDGRMDLSIVIRTLVIKDATAHIQVGGGITMDSDPAAEYQETLDKALALFLSLGLTENGTDRS